MVKRSKDPWLVEVDLFSRDPKTLLISPLLSVGAATPKARIRRTRRPLAGRVDLFTERGAQHNKNASTERETHKGTDPEISEFTENHQGTQPERGRGPARDNADRRRTGRRHCRLHIKGHRLRHPPLAPSHTLATTPTPVSADSTRCGYAIVPHSPWLPQLQLRPGEDNPIGGAALRVETQTRSLRNSIFSPLNLYPQSTELAVIC